MDIKTPEDHLGENGILPTRASTVHIGRIEKTMLPYKGVKKLMQSYA